MVALSKAEEDALTDGTIVFLGLLGLAGVGGAIDPHLNVVGVFGALAGGVISGLNTFRKGIGLAPVTPP